MDRVDEQKVGPARARGCRQIAEVGEIAHAPRGARPHRVQLRHEAPAAAAPRASGRVGHAFGRDDERHGCLANRRRALAATTERRFGRVHGVPAERQVGRQRHLDAPPRDAVDLAGGRLLSGDRQVAPRPVFERDDQAHIVPVAHVHEQRPRGRARHERGRQQSPPRRGVSLGERGRHRGIRRRIDVHGGEHRAQGRRGHGHAVAEERPVLRRDAVRVGETREIGRGAVSGHGCLRAAHPARPTAPRGVRRAGFNAGARPGRAGGGADGIQSARRRQLVPNPGMAPRPRTAPPHRLNTRRGSRRTPHGPGGPGQVRAQVRVSVRAARAARRDPRAAASGPAAAAARGAERRHLARRFRCRRTRAAPRPRPR